MGRKYRFFGMGSSGISPGFWQFPVESAKIPVTATTAVVAPTKYPPGNSANPPDFCWLRSRRRETRAAARKIRRIFFSSGQGDRVLDRVSRRPGRRWEIAGGYLDSPGGYFISLTEIGRALTGNFVAATAATVAVTGYLPSWTGKRKAFLPAARSARERDNS